MRPHKCCDAVLAEWAKEWRLENLNDATRKLIAQASSDLYWGPCEEDDYPGFTTACAAIRTALEYAPRELYVDDDCGGWQESEPEAERCDECAGEGIVYLSQPGFDDIAEKCQDCDGRGCFDPSGDWWHIERDHILEALVGKELKEYVR